MYRPLVSRFSAGGIAVDKVEADKLWVGHYINGDNADLSIVVDRDAMKLFDRPIIENTSHQYSSPELLNLDACHPDDKPSWWVVLRWMKIMFLKIARSYHAKPLLLAAAPLFFGILLGIWIGKWQSKSQLGQPKRIHRGNKKLQQEQQTHQPRIGRFAEFISAFCYSLSLTLTFCIPRNMLTTVCMNRSPARENSIATVCMDPALAKKNISVSKYVNQNDNVTIGDDSDNLRTEFPSRENEARSYLKSDEDTKRECDVPVERVPRHVAVIMDGNRRYGKSKYGSVAKGHWDGSSKLVEFAKWCLAEHIAVLTVFAFSSENWKRDPSEIASLMQIFAKYCDELRVEAIERNIRIMVLSTDYEKIPRQVRIGVNRMVKETQHCDGMIMNICLSYGSRDEIVGATKSVVDDVLQKKLDPKTIDENTIAERLLTYHCGRDPDVLIRTSGEIRISNFLLWQLAYTEFFFVDKPWPTIEKDDLLTVIRAYAKSRNRRYGK